jgi:hypothetical protein
MSNRTSAHPRVDASAIIDLQGAIAICRKAGYRVTMPKPKVEKTKGPTCVVQWADGETTRMTTHTPDTTLDFDRGIRVNAAAWQTRKRTAIAQALREATKQIDAVPHGERPTRALLRQHAKLVERWAGFDPLPLPAITRCHFERDGVVLGEPH